MSVTMTYQSARSEAVNTGIVERVRRYFAQRHLQSTIYAELDGMSDRDLADIGLSRHALKDVAREAARAV